MTTTVALHPAASSSRSGSRGVLATPWAIPAAVIVAGTLLRLPQLFHGLTEMHAFRQTQTAYVALEYARHGIDLSRTPLPIFGPAGDMPMEVPLVQAVGSLLIDAGIGPDAAVRVVGLASFQIAAALLTTLLYRWHGRTAAIVGVVLFQCSPYALSWGAASLIDFPSVACALGMVVGLDAWFRTGSRVGLIAGAISAWLAFAVKLTTPPGWCVLVLVAAVAAYPATRSWRRPVVGVLAGPAVGLVIGAAWTRFADGVKEDNPLTEPMTSSSLQQWNFGTLAQRLDPGTYAKIVGRIGGEIAGPLGLGLLIAIVGVVLAPAGIERLRRAGWLATAAFSVLVFFNLYYVHNYYLIAIFPAVIAAVAIGIAAVATRVSAARESVRPSAVAAIGTAVVLAGSAASPIGWNDVQQWWTSPPPNETAEAINAATAVDDLIIIVGCDYDPMTLYEADRRGLMFPEGPVDIWSDVDIDDYAYVFTCGPADARPFLPAGRTLEPTTVPGLARLVAG